MTRLIESDIDGLERELDIYEKELRIKTGMSLSEIACYAANMPLYNFQQATRSYRVAVVPITSGEGIIGGFSQSVAGIIKKVGFSASVTDETDVAGFYEGVCKGYELVFMADDKRFIALNLRTKKVIDNGYGTGRGYGAALWGMAKGLSGREVLVLGYGPVGSSAAEYLLEQGAKVAVYDKNEMRMKEIKEGMQGELDLRPALQKYDLLIDATSEGAFIFPEDLKSGVMIAAPGMPLGLNAHYRVNAGFLDVL
jgi:pyrrolysine biosynthesis protein PylD